MDKLLPGVETAAGQLSEHGGEKAAIAIKTTDTVHKTSVEALFEAALKDFPQGGVNPRKVTTRIE